MLPDRPTSTALSDLAAARAYLANLHSWEARRDQLVTAQTAARTALDGASDRATSLGGWAAQLTAALQATTQNAATVAQAETTIADATAQIATLESEIADTAQAREIATARLLAAPATSVPLVLLPLRLETRWNAGTLTVRIHPDVCSVDSHDPRLSAREQTSGAAYWQLRARPGVSAAAIDQAWAQLARNVGAGRAAWIIEATAPSASPPKTRDSGFEVTVTARLLPDRFAVVALSAGEPINVAPAGTPARYVSWTADVTDPLALELLAAPGGSSWLSDVAAATAAGMAIAIPVPVSAPPIDTLLVVGVRTTEPSPDLAGLLGAHAHTDGAEILADGVPTNNSDQITAAHSRQHDSDVARGLIETPPAAAPPDASAGGQLTALLGLPAATLTRIAGAHQPRAAAAAAMRLLVGHGSSGALADTLRADGAWGLVTPGGPAPTVRLGRQPYGILPASAPARWRAQTGETGTALQAALNGWGQAVGPPGDIDPLAPPAHPGTGTARRITPTDDTALLELLVEAASSLAFHGPDTTSAAPTITGDSVTAAKALAQIAAAAPGDLATLVPTLPTTLLTQLAVAAKQHAASLGATAASETTAVSAALGTLAQLAGGGQDDLQRLLTETLDARSHRFDAWVTGVVSERLTRQRASAPSARLGAYGWLTDVTPRGTPASHGHVLAPSVAHAATAAVLRSGFLGQRRQAWAGRLAAAQAAVEAAQALVDQRTAELAAMQRSPRQPELPTAINLLNQAERALTAAEQTVSTTTPLLDTLPPLDAAAEADLPLSVDLSSERVRGAQRTLRAVQNGQPLAAVLGHEFERDLVNAGQPRYLAAFRKLSRFRTGSALETLEQARDTAAQSLQAAQSTLDGVEAAQSSAEQALAAATAATAAAQAAVSHAQQSASPWHQLQREASTLTADIATVQQAIQALGSRPVPTIRQIPIEVPSIHGTQVGRENYQLQTTDADAPDPAVGWQQRFTQLSRQLDTDRARQTQIATTLATPTAVTQLQAEADAQQALGTATAAQTTAQERSDTSAQTAATFATQSLQPAQAALDAATAALSDGLATLLAGATSSTALTSIVDGLALRARYQAALAVTPPLFDHTTIPFRATAATAPFDPELDFPAVGEPDYTTVRAVLDQLDARVDTVADLITAEAVHQLVQGNPVRSGAALDLAAAGRIPDELEVIRTPQPGYDTTHRVLAAIDPAIAAAWTVAADAGATADPVLARWLTHHLPDPATVTVSVRFVDDTDVPVGAPVTVTGAQISRDPISWLRLSADPAEVEQRIAREARRPASSATMAGARVAIDTPTGPLAELIAPAAALRALIAGARALTAEDLVAPPDTAPAPTGEAAADLSARVRTVEQLVQARTDTLDRAAAANDVGALVDALLAVASLGDASATPQLLDGTPDLATLRAQAQQAAARQQHRLAQAPSPAAPGDPAAELTSGRARLGALCGITLPGLAAVAIPADGHLADDLAQSATRLAGAAPSQVRQWLRDRARVRPTVEALVAAYDVIEAVMSGGARLDVRASQRPDGSPASSAWLGSQGQPPPGGLNLVVQRGFSDPLPAEIVGLFIDAWTETIPAAQHAPAIAVHHDGPDSTPPQAILVAVAPDPTPGRQPATWDLDTLLDTLTSTLALAQDRAVAAERHAIAGVTIATGP